MSTIFIASFQPSYANEPFLRDAFAVRLEVFVKECGKVPSHEIDAVDFDTLDQALPTMTANQCPIKILEPRYGTANYQTQHFVAYYKGEEVLQRPKDVKYEVVEPESIPDGCKPIGTVRSYNYHSNTNKKQITDIKIGRMGVLAEWRQFGVGRELLAAAEDSVPISCTRCVLHAKYHKQKFYASQGYAEQGSIFMQENVPHILMVKQIKK